MNRRSLVLPRGLAAALVLVPSVALADVRREGQWPDGDPSVSLDLHGVPRGEALFRLAKAAGWSIVLSSPKDDRVSLNVSNQPAGKVLDLLLTDGRYVARRDGTMIAISPDSKADRGETPPPPPAPPSPPSLPGALPPLPVPPPPPPGAAEEADDDDRDRTVTGGSLRVEKGEVVHDVTVLGGTLDVLGTVTGDLTVLGGSARIHEGALVRGDATLMMGSLDIDSGATVGGDVGVLGGKLNRAKGAKIGGEVKDGVHRERARARKEAREARKEAREEAREAREEARDAAREARQVAKESEKDKPKGWLREVADAVNGAALLFVFGAVLLALAPDRMDQLKLQIATRPVRTFALGVVSLIAGIAIFAAVCVTLIGIPVAVVGALAAVLATFAGICSVLETVGAALLAHRTKSPYVHLAVGGLLFLVAGSIPWIGGLVKLAVVLTAIGSVVATRGAGLLPAKNRPASPYRDRAVT